jgi:flotillin
LITLLIVIVIFFAFNAMMVIRCFKKVPPDSVIIRTGIGGARVFTSGAVSFPIIHQYHQVNIAARQFSLSIDAPLKDGTHQQLTFSFTLRINRTPSDVLNAVQFAGVDRMANDQELLKLFKPQFEEAIKISAAQHSKEDINKERLGFVEHTTSLIGTNLNGFILEHVSLV